LAPKSDFNFDPDSVWSFGPTERHTTKKNFILSNSCLERTLHCIASVDAPFIDLFEELVIVTIVNMHADEHGPGMSNACLSTEAT
jgi:hypothetical protein